MSGGASRSWLEDAAARARFVAVVELEGVGADDADSATRLDESVAFARPRRGPARFSRIQAWVFPLVIVVGFAAMHAARVVPSAAGEDADESSARSLVMQSKFRSVAAGVVAVAGLACAGVAVGDAVEWRVEDGGNGHWYEALVLANPGMNWVDARVHAQLRGGDLASLESTHERTFATALVDLSQFSAWIGLYQVAGACEPGCDWMWVSGAPLGETNWAPREPNNIGGPYGDEDHALLAGFGWNGSGYSGRWVDWPGATSLKALVALIEYSTDCNSDGIVDYGQIRAGELVDTNANNIPDCCEQGVSCAPCPSDVDESGTVNGVDLAAILAVWGSDGGKYPRADINNDGEVNGADLATVLGSWGSCK